MKRIFLFFILFFIISNLFSQITDDSKQSLNIQENILNTPINKTTWDVTAGTVKTRDLLGYNIYIDGVFIGWFDMFWIEMFYYWFVPGQSYIIGIEAVYTNGAGPLIEFIYIYNPALNSVEDFYVTSSGYVSWDPPGLTENSRDLLGYNIYLNVDLITFTTDLFYQYDENSLIEEQLYVSGVTAVYDEGESSTEFGFFNYLLFNPMINVTPDEINVTLDPEELTYEDLIVSNPGSDILFFEIEVNYLSGDSWILLDTSYMYSLEAGESNNVIFEHDYDKNYLYRLALCKNINKVFATNYNIFTIESFSGDGNYVNSILVGGRAFQSCYNDIEQKIYYYEENYEDIDNVNVYIYDIETESFDILNIGHSISDIEYNDYNHLLYVSSYRTNSIRVFDVLNNHTELQPIILSHPYVHGIFVTPNNKLFCSTQTGIEIWNLTNNQFENYIYTPTCNRSQFCMNSIDNVVYVSVRRFGYTTVGRVLAIDIETNNLLNSSTIQSPDKIEYDPISNKVILNQRNYGFLPNSYISMDCNTYNYDTITTDEPVLYIELAENMGKLYVTPFGYDGEIYEYSTLTNELLRTFQTTAVASVTKYNPLNNKLYVLVPYNFTQDLQTDMWVIDCTTAEVTGLQLNQCERNRLSLPVIRIDFTLDEESNKIFFGTGHSNHIVLQCDNETESKTYTFPSQFTIPDAGWKWLSFDILYPDQNDNVAEFFLAPISGFDELDHALFKPHENNSTQQTIRFHPTQQNLNHPFTSPYGYKFKTINACEFTVTGQRCEAETSIHLYGNDQENWIGYFLEETQLVYDAFAGHLDEITKIKAQHWAIKKVNGVWPPDIAAAYTISPGDMVIVYCERDIPAFSWNFEESREKYVIPESQDFTYEEEADYIPVFIELDPNDLPSEIGASVDGECKGATVVQDTTAQICAYILENQGEDLEFEFSYGSREQNKQIKEYGICEPETSKTVRGTIQIDNSRDCYYVSFKDGQNNTPVPAKIEITNFPNPFNPETTLFFSLPNEQEIELTVYNLKGQKVRQLARGQFPSGEHSVIWEGKDDNGKQVSSGVYLYKLETADKIISKKMLLLK